MIIYINPTTIDITRQLIDLFISRRQMEKFKVWNLGKEILNIHNMQFKIKGQIVFGKAFEVLSHPSRIIIVIIIIEKPFSFTPFLPLNVFD